MSQLLEKIFPQEYHPEKHAKVLDNTRISILNYVIVLLPLCLIGLFIEFFNLEQNLNLIKIVPSVIIGFAIHAWLPLRFRLPFFCLITLITIFSLVSLWDGIFLIAFSCGLIALAHLPIAVKLRIYAVIAATIVLALFRVNIIPFEGTKAIVPIIGALFMFRMVLYLYELQYEKPDDTSWWKRVTYFFMLPNLVFPIFPIVDWKTYKRNYFSKPAFDLYQKGIWWMTKGILQMYAYRIIYYYLIPAPRDVLDIYGLLLYCAASYALIIRISGIMHFATGALALFGFDLPETFNNYFLANSFSDLWRRVNIYWKDFMMKIFYYPFYFVVKKMGANTAMFITILVVFAINWFLHGYQWFWVIGTFPITPPDVLFWTLFGLLVAFNSIYQQNTSKKRVDKKVFSVKHAFNMTARILGMLLFMSVLWSFWTSSSVMEWLTLMTILKFTSLSDILVLLAGAAVFLVVGVALHYVGYLQNNGKFYAFQGHRPRLVTSFIVLPIVVALGIPQVHEPIAASAGIDMDPVLHTRLNKRDKEIQFRGYYESMFAENSMFSQAGEAERRKPDDWLKLGSTGIVQQMKNVEYKRMKPNKDVMFKRARLTSNSHGLRDFEYSKEKPANTLRIAMLGGSIEMGSGVRDQETFENVFERLANREDIYGDFDRIEVLNFAISGIHLPQHLYYTENKVLAFDPDIVIYTAHPDEERRIINNLHMTVKKGLDLHYPGLKEVVKKNGAKAKQDEEEFQRALEGSKRKISTWGYNKIAEICQENNIIPVWAYIPVLEDIYVENEFEELSALADHLGYHVVDLSDAYTDKVFEDLHLAIWDKHPNWKGHKLLGEELFEQMKADEEIRQAIENREQGTETALSDLGTKPTELSEMK